MDETKEVIVVDGDGSKLELTMVNWISIFRLVASILFFWGRFIVERFYLIRSQKKVWWEGYEKGKESKKTFDQFLVTIDVGKFRLCFGSSLQYTWIYKLFHF